MLFIFVLAPLLAIAVAVCLLPALIQLCKKGSQSANDTAFNRLQKTYLVVYGFAVAGDWLQGAHLYELYADAGIPKNWIELLFLAGFLSSLLFGTVIGGLADKVGRKKIAILYAFLYILTCTVANFSKLWLFAIGRISGGIATSILFSAFESWVVHEHAERGFTENQLGTLFSNAGLLNSGVAVISGLAAQQAVNFWGNAGPFNLAIVDLCIMLGLIVFIWQENYGNHEVSVASNFGGAFKTIFSDLNILCLGLTQSLFEGVMYTFIVQWTPAMKEAFAPRELDFGYIFATFMVAVSIGSSVFKYISKVAKPESFMIAVFFLSAACMVPPYLFPHNAALTYAGFILFEACVGIFWPAMSTMRGMYLPEEGRSTIMNIFRMPLNLIVVAMMVADFRLKTTFIICTALLILAALCQMVLFLRAGRHSRPQVEDIPATVSPAVKYVAIPQSHVEIEEKTEDLVENSNQIKYPNLEDAHLQIPLIDEEDKKSALSSTVERDPPVPPSSPVSVDVQKEE